MLFNIDFTFLWTLVNLLILYFVLRKVLFGRVGKVIDDRANAITADMEKGKADVAQGEKFREEQQAILHEATAERARILEGARQKAASEYDAAVANAKVEAARIITAAGEDAEREREKMLSGIKDEVASLALAAASKVLQANVDTQKNRELVEEFLKDEGAA